MKTGAPGWARSSREPRSITTGGRTTDRVVWVGFAAAVVMAPHAIERAARSAAPARASGARNDPKPVDCWIERVEADILSSLSTDRRSLVGRFGPRGRWLHPRLGRRRRHRAVAPSRHLCLP